MNARAAAMTTDPERNDPDVTLETVPPPQGAKDPYSAQTRVGTLPEDVLEAMRQHAPDASLEKRTKSGMQRAAARPLAAPAVPSFAEAAALPLQDPARAPRPASPVVAAPVVRPRRRVLTAIAIIVMFAALGALLATVLVFAAS